MFHTPLAIVFWWAYFIYKVALPSLRATVSDIVFSLAQCNPAEECFK